MNISIKAKVIFWSFISLFLVQGVSAQTQDKKDFRGINTPNRSWWNVLYYDLTIEPDYATQSIKGKNIITYERLKNNQFDMQIDLQPPMHIDSVMAGKINVPFTRKGNTYTISLFDALLYDKNNKESVLTISFSGKPNIAKNAPWDGGWIFTKDDNNQPWMAVACEGIGASSWFPCKDFFGDEPDRGMKMTLITSKDLMGIGNGKMLLKNNYELPKDKKDNKKDVKNKTATTNKTTTANTVSTGKMVYVWQVTSPINAYNIIPYIGDYKEITDFYEGERGKLPLDYWVLSNNIDKAKKQFAQVKSMLKSFEYWFGAYPFYKDGYKLVESPYLGMEHQSNIAYGNKYQNGYLGEDRSGTGVGLKWDFIIVHESAHEWFGNSITCSNPADMWIHEAFATYAETLFVESLYGKKEAEKYLIGQRKNIKNDISIADGSDDMYDKGASMLHTLRQWINNDGKFRQMLRDMNEKFYLKTVSGKEIENFMASETGLNLTPFFDQYLRTPQIPVLEYYLNGKGTIFYHWANEVSDLNMPIETSAGKLTPTDKWQSISASTKFSINPNYYVELRETTKPVEVKKTTKPQAKPQKK